MLRAITEQNLFHQTFPSLPIQPSYLCSLAEQRGRKSDNADKVRTVARNLWEILNKSWQLVQSWHSDTVILSERCCPAILLGKMHRYWPWLVLAFLGVLPMQYECFKGITIKGGRWVWWWLSPTGPADRPRRCSWARTHKVALGPGSSYVRVQVK